MPRTTKKKEKKRKLALVMSGGGMRCAYGVGVLTALIEEYGMTKPDILIAASGSAGGAAYYLSGQYRETISAWLSLLPSKRLISFRRRRVLDVDYLVDEIFKKMHPFDFKALSAVKTLLIFAATRAKDGKTVYLKVPRDKRIYEYLRATKAVPIAYGKRVTIGRSEYVDGDFGSDTEDLVEKAFSLGANDVVVVENSPAEFLQKEKRRTAKAMRTIEKWRKDVGMLQAVKRELVEKATMKAPKGCTLVRIAPLRNLHIGTLENKKLKLRTVFNVGYADARDNEALRKLLTKKT